MKYTPKELGEADDASRGKTTIADKLKDALSVVIVLGAIYVVLGLVADLTALYIPDSVEAKLGVLTPDETLEDHPRQKEIEALFAELISYPHLRKLPYRLVLLSYDQPNAFAFPGGTIGITEGLLEKVKSEKSITMVIGHELGHHYHRHTLRRMGRTLFSALFSSMLGTSGAGKFTSSGFEAAQLSYSRSQETEADEFAVDLLKKHYGNIEGAFEFFEFIVKQDKSEIEKWASMLGTHPYTPDRIQNMKTYANSVKD